ncbi:hypothetical protein ABPG77_008938 [Micractinium sp. CCAP 211/92]
MASSQSTVRKALQGLEDGLAVFTQQLAAEAAELRRNVENRPRTGATYYRNILEDLQQRAEGLGQELAALEAVSTEAVSLEELVGHSVALYCQNHRQIQELEAQLAQYGYRDLFAPLPPENPLDMLEVAGSQDAAGSAAGVAPGCSSSPHRGAPGTTGGGEHGGGAELYGLDNADGAPVCQHDTNHDATLGEVTNRLATAQLNAACNPDSPPPPAAQRWAGGAPRTTLKAMAPMTAAKALMRADTPSSMASPAAMSPSMRELLGKYATSSSGGGTHLRASTAPCSAGGSTPLPDRGGQSMSPAPAYLSPAFQLAAMDQEVQMAHAEAAAASQGGAGDTPDGAAAPGWQADDAMYSALTATARKLAGKPSFMEAYRQKFPAIMASTERLLQTVEKQRRPAAAAAVAEEEAAAGPVAALALAAAAAAGHEMAAPALAASARHQVQHSLAADLWHGADVEESTLDLMAQVIHSRPAAEELREDMPHAASAVLAAPMPTPQAPPGSAIRSAACPPPPPTAPSMPAAATAPAAQAAVPPLRPVGPDEYSALPTFIRSGLPLDTLNAALAAVNSMVQERSTNGFTMEDVEASGLAGAKHKVVVNSLVKLGRVQLHVARGGQGGTLYLLV